MISDSFKVIQLISGDSSPGSLISEPLRHKATMTNWTLALPRSVWITGIFFSVVFFCIFGEESIVNLDLHQLTTGVQTDSPWRRLSLPRGCAAPQAPCSKPSEPLHPHAQGVGPAGGA